MCAKTTEKRVELRGAELALEDAIRKLRRSVHPKDCDEGRTNDKKDGSTLASRIRAHMNDIQVALDYWEQAQKYYEQQNTGR